MRSSLLALVSSLAVYGGMAAPTDWSADSAKLYSGVGNEVENIRRHGSHHKPSCDLSEVKLPQTSEPLPDVPHGQRLLAIGVGRGIQNYTCEESTEDAEPKAVGAIATLFDASCMASNYPYLFSLLPNIALSLTQPPPFTEAVGPAEMGVLGHHFFDSEGVPIFDVKDLGSSAVGKTAAVDAPSSALKGVSDQLEGAVAWLMLEAVESSEGKAKTVYRVLTAGGKSPATCADQPETISVEYAAQYWFYG